MNDGALKTSMPSVQAVGSFVTVRGKAWIVEGAEQRGPVQALTLISCEDDSQGEAIELVYAAELQPEILDPNDWSPLLAKTFGGPQRLGAYLRSTEWRTATAADRKLFQAPFRAGIRLDSYQLLPLAKALDLPRVNLLIADDVGLGKTIEAGLIVRELLLRRRVEMIVVAAPASMLLQWQDELARWMAMRPGRNRCLRRPPSPWHRQRCHAVRVRSPGARRRGPPRAATGRPQEADGEATG
jgi:SNF2-related domain